MNKDGIENQLEQLRDEAGFQKDLKVVFGTDAGLRVFEYILSLGNFGGVIKGDFDSGRYYVSSQMWADVMRAAPDVVKGIIDLRYNEVRHDREKQFKQLETQLKEVDNE